MVAGLGGWRALSLGQAAVSSNQVRLEQRGRTGPVWFTCAPVLRLLYLQRARHTASGGGDGEHSVDSQARAKLSAKPAQIKERTAVVDGKVLVCALNYTNSQMNITYTSLFTRVACCWIS